MKSISANLFYYNKTNSGVVTPMKSVWMKSLFENLCVEMYQKEVEKRGKIQLTINKITIFESCG